MHSILDIMGIGVCLYFLLLITLVPWSQARCPGGMYCPADVNCATNSTLCKPAICLGGRDFFLLENSNEDCDEGIASLYIVINA